MAKYIDAELLRKEVKRLEKAAHKSALGCADSEIRKFHEGKDAAYQHVAILIDSLQQEQQDVDLEQNIEMEWDSFNKHLAEYDKESEEVVWLNRFSFEDIANYFYELGRKQVLQEIYDGKTKPVDKITAAWLDDKEEDK